MLCCIYFAHTEEGRKREKEFGELCQSYQIKIEEKVTLLEAEAKLKKTEEERKSLENEIIAFKVASKEAARYQAFLEFTNKDK